MARPRKPVEGRIFSLNYTPGHADPVNGQYVVHVSTTVVWTGIKVGGKGSIAKVRDVIDTYAQTHLERKKLKRAGIVADVQKHGMAQAAIGASSQVSLYEAVSRWYEEFYRNNKNIGDPHRRHVLLTIQEFTPAGCDIPLAPTAETLQRIVTQFAMIKAGRNDADNTMRKHLLIWKRAFAWMIAMGWLQRNPIDQLQVPKKQPKRADKRRYQDRELMRIMRELEQIDPEVRRLCLWLRRTGMRISEALAMKWEHITEELLQLFGKGRNNVKRIRHLPLVEQDSANFTPAAVWQRSLHTLLARQREYIEKSLAGVIKTRGTRKRRFRQGYVWGIASASYIRTLLTEAKRRAESSFNDGRAFHTFRAQAEHYLMYYVGLSEKRALAIAGHSKRIYDEHYRIEEEGVELVTAVRQLSEAGT